MQKRFDDMLEKMIGEAVSMPSQSSFVSGGESPCLEKAGCRRPAVLLAVSGGVDSICMADLFLHSSVKVDFALAHCNFHLRGEESDGDEAYVAVWAEENGVRMYRTDFDTVAWAREHSVSVEMAARELRYRWFAQLCDDYGYVAVAVAHNANDNAETLILNLVRGTGMRGLAGIRAVSSIPFVEKGYLIRPLLSFTRKQIEGYAMAHGIRWREDSTNASCEYKRNKVRNSVFPILESLNPSFVKTFNREMEYFSEAGDIVNEYCSMKAASVSETEDGALIVDVAGLIALKHWKSILYHILEPYGFNSSSVASLSELLSSERTVSGKTFVSDTHELITASGRLIVRKQTPCRAGSSNHAASSCNVGHDLDIHNHSLTPATSIDDPVMVIRGAGNYRFNGTSFTVEVREYSKDMSLKMPSGTIAFDADRLPFPLVCRRWMKGDWFRPLGLRGKKKVSDMFTDLKYDVLQKESSIMIVDPNKKGTGSHISAVLGVRIDDSLKVTADTRRIVIVKTSCR